MGVPELAIWECHEYTTQLVYNYVRVQTGCCNKKRHACMGIYPIS